MEHYQPLANNPNHNDPQAFIANYNYHWIGLRYIYNNWWLFNSLASTPQYLTESYLMEYLQSMIDQNLSVFILYGRFPNQMNVFLFFIISLLQPTSQTKSFYYPISKLTKAEKTFSFSDRVSSFFTQKKDGIKEKFRSSREMKDFKKLLNDFFGTQPKFFQSSVSFSVLLVIYYYQINFPDDYSLERKFDPKMTCCELYDLIRNIMEIIYNYNMDFQIIGDKEEIILNREIALSYIKSKVLYITI